MPDAAAQPLAALDALNVDMQPSAVPRTREDCRRLAHLHQLIAAEYLRHAGEPPNDLADLADLAPARWFTRNTLVNADMLAKAPDADVGRIRRPGKQHLFSKRKVSEYRPDRWQHPRTNRPPK